MNGGSSVTVLVHCNLQLVSGAAQSANGQLLGLRRNRNCTGVTCFYRRRKDLGTAQVPFWCPLIIGERVEGLQTESREKVEERLPQVRWETCDPHSGPI